MPRIAVNIIEYAPTIGLFWFLFGGIGWFVSVISLTDSENLFPAIINLIGSGIFFAMAHNLRERFHYKMRSL